MYLIVDPAANLVFLWTGMDLNPSPLHGIASLCADSDVSRHRIFRRTGRVGRKAKGIFLRPPERACRLLLALMDATHSFAVQVKSRIRDLRGLRLELLSLAAFFTVFSTQSETPRSGEKEDSVKDYGIRTETLSHLRELLSKFSATDPRSFQEAGVWAIETTMPFPQAYFSLLSLHEDRPDTFELTLEAPYRRVYVIGQDKTWRVRFPIRVCNGLPHYRFDSDDQIAMLFNEDKLAWIEGMTLSAVPRHVRRSAACHHKVEVPS